MTDSDSLATALSSETPGQRPSTILGPPRGSSRARWGASPHEGLRAFAVRARLVPDGAGSHGEQRGTDEPPARRRRFSAAGQSRSEP